MLKTKKSYFYFKFRNYILKKDINLELTVSVLTSLPPLFSYLNISILMQLAQL